MGTKDQSLIRFGFVEPAYLRVAGFILLGAFLSLGSNLGLQAPLLVVGFAWALHLTVGLAAIRMGVIHLSRWQLTAHWSDLWLLGAAGFLASLLLAPTSFLIDQCLLTLGIDTDDERLVGVTQWLYGTPLALIEEWTHVVGPTVLVALLLGLPAWWARRKAAPVSDEPSSLHAGPPLQGEVSRAESSQDHAKLTGAKLGTCLQRLPPALGLDLIAARSELQYVRVYTTRGDALVLGALKDIAEQRQSEGQLVHRAWWVSNQHVRTLRRRGSRYILTLSNEVEVPVSRRRQSSVLHQFGSTTTLN